MKVVQLHEQTPKQFSHPTKIPVVEPYPNPKNSPLGPQKVKNDPKIKSNSNVRDLGIAENKPKNSPLGYQKVQNNPKIKSILNVRIEGNKENENYCTI